MSISNYWSCAVCPVVTSNALLICCTSAAGFMDFPIIWRSVHRTFWKLDIHPSSGENLWSSYSFLSLRNNFSTWWWKRPVFLKFSSFQSAKRWAKPRNPVTLIINLYHRQSPLDSGALPVYWRQGGSVWNNRFIADSWKQLCTITHKQYWNRHILHCNIVCE
jgi:hypothetical protein